MCRGGVHEKCSHEGCNNLLPPFPRTATAYTRGAELLVITRLCDECAATEDEKKGRWV